MTNLAKAEWELSEGAGTRIVPTARGWRMKIPSRGSAGYILTVDEHENRSPSELVLTYSIAARPGAEFIAVDRKGDEGAEPNFRPILYGGMGDATKPNNRFWPDECITLAKGKGTERYPLDPDHWTNVKGKPASSSKASLQAFRRLCRRARYGVTFGGGWNAGHGVKMRRGIASVTLTQFVFA
jgi:hypothetical protein